MADMDTIVATEASAEAGNWVRTVKDLGAGAAGGVAQVLLGEFLEYLCMCARYMCESDSVFPSRNRIFISENSRCFLFANH